MHARVMPMPQKTRNFQLYNVRHHLKHPIPLPLIIIPIEKALCETEWYKFCDQLLTPKQMLDCERKRDGAIHFLGEGGLDALKVFQAKYLDRFHFRMMGASKEHVAEGLQLAMATGLRIDELHYKNGHNAIMLNDKNVFLKLIEPNLEGHSEPEIEH